ncbi:Cupredoxin [Mycena polygramma]|nr:Cupredoxin [Mycena polygramma]
MKLLIIGQSASAFTGPKPDLTLPGFGGTYDFKRLGTSGKSVEETEATRQPEGLGDQAPAMAISMDGISRLSSIEDTSLSMRRSHCDLNYNFSIDGHNLTIIEPGNATRLYCTQIRKSTTTGFAPYPGGADVTLNMNIAVNFTSLKFLINGATFVPPTAPVLLQILSGAQDAQDLLPSGSVYTLPPNKVIKISIPGGSPGAPHPFHLHGHNFHVIRSAGNASYNFHDPVIRDVVSTGPSTSDNTTFRFVTDNAEFLHCHIDWHLEIGLAVVLAEDMGTLKKEKTPHAWEQLCPIYDKLELDQL